MSSQIVWKAKKRLGFLGLPWTFTSYLLREDKLIITTGFLNKKEDEIRLYRILDMTLTRSFGQRMFGLGTITCNTSDATSPVLAIKNIKKSGEVKEALSELVEKERVAKRVSAREFMSDHEHDGCEHDHELDNDSFVDELH